MPYGLDAKHTVRAYGTMWVSFMASMIATELAYCRLADTRNILRAEINDETSNCYDEMLTMVLDPGMNLGVIAMTATSISLNKHGNKALNRFFRNLTGPYGRAALNFSRTMLTHLSMGAGMINQTSIASSWNEPRMRKCFQKMVFGSKEALKSRGIMSAKEAHESDEGREIVANATDKALEEPICVQAWNQFKNNKDGTMSEIYITVMSLGISSVTAGVVMSAVLPTIRYVGMAMLGWNFGALGMIGGMVVANQAVEMADRVWEPIIRDYYHSRRSKRQNSFAFIDLVEAIDASQSSGSLVEAYDHKIRCISRLNGAKHRGACREFETERRYRVPVVEAIDKFKEMNQYRREGSLNRFTESRGRWTEKVSNVQTVAGTFQQVMKLIYKIRDDLKNEENINKFSYNELSLVMNIKDSLDIPKFAEMENLEQSSGFTKGQIKQIYQSVLDPLYQIVKNDTSSALAYRNNELRKLLLSIDQSFKQNDIQRVQIGLWLLKGLFSSDFVFKRHGAFIALTDDYVGHRFSKKEIELYNKKITNSITSFNSRVAYAAVEFDKAGIPLYTKLNLASEDSQTDEASQTSRRGVIQTQSLPAESLLKMNKDDGLPFKVNELLLFSDKKNEGIDSENLSAKILTHLFCGESPKGLEFFWRDGWASRVTLPNILKDMRKMNCHTSHHKNIPYTDFLYNPRNGEVEVYQGDEALHRIYEYDGKPHIGLLSVAIDPEVEFIWPNYEAFQKHWNNVLRDRFEIFLLKSRKEYYETISDYLVMFSDDDDFVKTLNFPISEQEISQRRELNWLAKDGRSYYAKIYSADTYVDEVRTYAYLASRVFGEMSQVSGELTSLIPRYNALIRYLNFENRDFNFEVDSLSEAEIKERITNLPFPEVLGVENVEAFSAEFNALKAIMRSKLELAQVTELPGQTELENYDKNRIKSHILYKIYKNLDDSLNTLEKVTLKEYIGGASITFEL
jgi:hypothetical protein